jgi:hypothetical protein
MKLKFLLLTILASIEHASAQKQKNKKRQMQKFRNRLPILLNGEPNIILLTGILPMQTQELGCKN